jgi:hypothetical protein
MQGGRLVACIRPLQAQANVMDPFFYSCMPEIGRVMRLCERVSSLHAAKFEAEFSGRRVALCDSFVDKSSISVVQC